MSTPETKSINYPQSGVESVNELREREEQHGEVENTHRPEQDARVEELKAQEQETLEARSVEESQHTAHNKQTTASEHYPATGAYLQPEEINYRNGDKQPSSRSHASQLPLGQLNEDNEDPSRSQGTPDTAFERQDASNLTNEFPAKRYVEQSKRDI